jgi:phospholipase/carboxylesterase
VTDKQSNTIYDSGWMYRIHSSNNENKTRVCILFHGWTGDEKSTDIFLRAFPSSYCILSPRGPVESNEGGYGWIPFRPSYLAPFSDFKTSAEILAPVIDRWIDQNKLPGGKLTLVGFSQGAAMALCFGITFPDRVERIASLSGFLPNSSSLPDPRSLPLKGLQVYISHGTQDEIIPINRAREGADWLNHAGAIVSTCESNVGHRVSATCFRGLKEFLS